MLRNPASVIVVLLSAMLLASPACAEYYFYSVANDGQRDNNDWLWDALDDFPNWTGATGDRALLRDHWESIDPDRDDGRDSLYDDLLWYGENLVSGDVFVFSYWGYGNWGAADADGDDGTTPRPSPEEDPDPPNPPPYARDETFGKNGTTWMSDDQLADALDSFNPGVEVIVISGGSFSGGWVGGSDDIDHSVPADSHGLYAILAAPENAHGRTRSPGDRNLLEEALEETIGPDMTASDWYNAAMQWGEAQSYWPAADWVPSEAEKTWDPVELKWGWQDNYAQLRPPNWSSLDAGHDRLITTPEPGAGLLLGAGLAAWAYRCRRTARRQRGRARWTTTWPAAPASVRTGSSSPKLPPC